MSLNFKEIGQIIRVNVDEDISLATPTLILRPELGVTKEITDGVTIGTVLIITDLETFNPNGYIEYKTVAEDLNYVGRWQKKAKLEFSSTNIQQTDFSKFRVLP